MGLPSENYRDVRLNVIGFVRLGDAAPVVVVEQQSPVSTKLKEQKRQ